MDGVAGGHHTHDVVQFAVPSSHILILHDVGLRSPSILGRNGRCYRHCHRANLHLRGNRIRRHCRRRPCYHLNSSWIYRRRLVVVVVLQVPSFPP